MIFRKTGSVERAYRWKGMEKILLEYGKGIFDLFLFVTEKQCPQYLVSAKPKPEFSVSLPHGWQGCVLESSSAAPEGAH